MPRSVNARIDWFLNHKPSGPGMCAQHTWHSLGNDVPAWGAPNANSCVDKVRASGRYWTPETWDGPPPRGAWIGYKYGANGHACLSYDGAGKIATTDPDGNSGGVGIEDISYPNKWGASGWDVWTDEYNGVRFDIDYGKDEEMPLTDSDIEAIAARVNHVLGDYTADGTPTPKDDGEANPEPETGSTRLRQIEKRVRALEDLV